MPEVRNLSAAWLVDPDAALQRREDAMAQRPFEAPTFHDEIADATVSNEMRGSSGPDGGAFRRTATRADLLDVVYAACPGLSRNQAREIFESMLEEVTNALVQGESVKLRGFGFFNVRAKNARVGRNPRTGIEAPITPRRVLTFKASPVLQDTVRKGLVRSAEGDEKVK